MTTLLTPSTPLLPDGITLRLAEAHELEQVAALQMDIFAPEDDPPAMPALIQGLFEANQRAARAGMRKRLTDELITRVDKGSDIITAVAEGEGDASMHAGDTANGLYTEPGPPLLGAVDVSCQEMMLPTHAIAGGLYLSHMAVAESARPRAHRPSAASGRIRLRFTPRRGCAMAARRAAQSGRDLIV